MSASLRKQLDSARRVFHSGGVIAYPTESCFGLGCNPKDYQAVKKILTQKHRPASKGLILIGNDFSQLSIYLSHLPEELIYKMTSSWPSATTWLCPAAAWVPSWLKGNSEKIAVRVPAHRLARLLCKHCGHALVSTSANLSGQRSLRTAKQVEKIFADKIDLLIASNCGRAKQPSSIIDLTTDAVLR